MTDLTALLAQREALDEQIAVTRKEERTAVIASMREQIAAFELLPNELFGKSSQKGC